MSAGNAIAPRPQAAAPSPKDAYPGQPAPSAGPPQRRRPLPSLSLRNKLSALTLLALTFIPAHHASAQIFDSTNAALTYTITENLSRNFNFVQSNLGFGSLSTLATGVFTNQNTMGMYGTFVFLHTGADSGQLTYTLDNSNPTVDALDAGDTLTESFTVVGEQTNGAQAGPVSAVLTINIQGANDPPQAGIVGGPSISVDEDATVTLDGSDSSDAEGDMFTYAWTQTGGTPTVTLMNPATQTATFTAPNGNALLVFTLTVTSGAQMDTAMLIVTVAPNAPTFGDTIPRQNYTSGTAISVTLPAATGGDGTLTHAITETLPDGLTFTAATRVLSGIPTTTQDRTTYTYTATDADTTNPDSAQLRFTITIAADLAPTFGATIAPQTYPINNAVNVTLPAATGGNGTLTYAITEPLPDGLTFTPATRVLDGTPTAEQDEATYTYTATDSDTPNPDTTELPFTITIADLMPVIVFADGSSITVDEGAEVTLDATGSSDPEGQGLMYQWAQVQIPDDAMPVTFNPANGQAQTVTFMAPEERTRLTFTLTLTDGTGKTDTETLTVQVGRSQFDNVHRAILPEVTRAMMDTTVSAIARRTEQAATDHDASAGATFSLGGQSTLADVLQSNGDALNTGAFTVKSLLGRSAFALPLNQAGGPLAGVTLWGNGAYRNLSGNSATVDWDGDLFGATVGGDTWLTDTLLTGLAVSWADGTFDYTDRSGADPAPGTYQATLTSLHPYVSTSLLDGQVTLWATGGYGWGEVEITDTADPTAEGTVTADTRLATAAVGGAGRLLNQPGLLTPDGTTTVRVKAEVLTTAIKAEQQGDRLAGLTTDARRLRLTLEGSHEQPLPHGAHLTPSVGVGLRHDAGDGRTGTGAEVSGGLRYAHPALRLTLESRGRVLLAHGGDYDDWSVSGRVTLAPGAQGQGLAVTLEPTYQTTTSAGGLAQLWEHGTANRPAPSGPTTPQGLMDATVAYGLPVGDHLLTPYGGMTLGAADARTYRLGSRVSLAQRLNMSLEGARKGATGTTPVDHGVRLQLEWHW